MFIVGGLMVVYYWLIFDTTTVSFEGSRVHNIGLISDRTTGVTAGIGFLVGGCVFLAKRKYERG